MFQHPQVDARRCQPWTKYFFAFLESKGISQVLDTMRYESAFLCRAADADALKQATRGLEGVSQPLRVLLCKTGEGKRPPWVYGRLLSVQKLVLVDTAAELFELESPVTETRPKGLKWELEGDVTGTAEEIIDAMFQLRAFPENEGDAHKLEESPFSPSKVLTVRLRKYGFSERDWRLK